MGEGGGGGGLYLRELITGIEKCFATGCGSTDQLIRDNERI